MKIIFRVCILWVVFGFGGFAAQVSDEAVGVDSPTRFGFDARTRLIDNLPTGFFTPVTSPNRAIPIQQLCTDWEPSSMVLLSVPLAGTLSDTKVFAFIKEFLQKVVLHTCIGILYNRDEERQLGRFIFEIEKNPLLKEYSERIDFVESRAQSLWIRDYGPQFARSYNGELVLLDTIYRFLEVESVYDPTQVNAFSLVSQKNYANDLTPQYVAKFLRADYQYEAILTRPPLHLPGGDFATDGAGNVFVSEDTILNNGGEWDSIESVFNKYYEAENMHVLNPPSGNTAKHLDLLFKIADQNTFLVSRTPDSEVLGSSHSRKLAQQLIRTQRNNVEYLERNFPEKKIVTLPMPSLLTKSRTSRLDALRREVLNVVCRESNVDFMLVLSGNPKSPDVDSARNAVALEMLVKTGLNINLGNEGHLEIVSQKYLGVGVDEFLETYVEDQAIYRSYTNSLIITNSNLEHLILLPRFLPQEGESQVRYDSMEREVESVYLSLYPEARLEWINADDITSLGGSIHCMSVSVPVQNMLTTSRILKNRLF
ncbi:MAG: agmatine deiminase family protein [Opitutales bacterium]